MMQHLENLNHGWVFCGEYADGQEAAAQPGQEIALPHNAVDLPLSYFDEAVYQRRFLYQRVIDWTPGFAGRDVALQFDGAMAHAHVYLNGALIAVHKDGYTPFTARFSDHMVEGENLISVVIDGAENPDIPPFGGQIDYLTYAGIYRDVWLHVAPPVSIGAVKVETLDVLDPISAVRVLVEVADRGGAMQAKAVLTCEVRTADGKVLGRAEDEVTAGTAELRINNIADAMLWSLDNPVLYTARVRLASGGQEDLREVVFGFRTAEWRADGFYLNGEKLHLRGLNRHQSFPYVGYAMGRRAQERDAEILKNDLACNVVRTSHYPQSPWFLDHCDRIGLLVVEEIPGWQHIGGPEWKAASVANVAAMIRRDWNHPSIIMWGVRINESADDHDFYAETNRVASDLDPTRATGGIRCIEDSELLEDVYTMNDFFHAATQDFRGNRPPAPLRSRAEVTGLDQPVPYLVTEFNGHMFPTKRTDSEGRQAEHVMRYLEVLDRAYGTEGLAGSIGWCMFDYNTHKDFGSGDRICHHGVLDAFRAPKFAAHVYTSQRPVAAGAVLEPVTFWARGEREIGGVLPLIVLCNCDYVEMQFGDYPVRRVHPDRERFPNLPHAPVIIDERSVSAEDAGAWGMEWADARFVGYVDHQPVITRRFAAAPLPTTLSVVTDESTISAASRGEVRVIVRALDQVGNVLPYLDEVIYLEVAGPARVLGPDVLPMKGGHAGFWLRSDGAAGEIGLKVFGQRLGLVERTISAV